MKKHEFKMWKEFKAFINRGSVLDLAVGMIIGGAFTAIVSALVNNILKPLINWIPIGKNGTGLQTILRAAVLDADGNVLTEALILDWGAVISAIVTFLLTALVLFLVIKAINSAKKFSDDAKHDIEKGLEKLSGKKTAEKITAEDAAINEAAATEPVPADIAVPVSEETIHNRKEELLEQILKELKEKN